MLKAELVRVQTELSLDCHLGDGCVCVWGEEDLTVRSKIFSREDKLKAFW